MGIIVTIEDIVSGVLLGIAAALLIIHGIIDGREGGDKK